MTRRRARWQQTRCHRGEQENPAKGRLARRCAVTSRQETATVNVASSPTEWTAGGTASDPLGAGRTMEDNHKGMVAIRSQGMDSRRRATGNQCQSMGSHYQGMELQCSNRSQDMALPCCRWAGSRLAILRVGASTTSTAQPTRLRGTHPRQLPHLRRSPRLHLRQTVVPCHLVGKRQQILPAVRRTISIAPRTVRNGTHQSDHVSLPARRARRRYQGSAFCARVR